MTKKRGMGKRGLSVLTGAKIKSENNTADLRIEKMPLASLVPGTYQPRQQFDQDALEELASSIKIQGIVQPIIVKAHAQAGQYEIIAGERRWRAAKLAGLQTVPVVVRQADNQATLAMALIENMQREDLNPIEEAIGLKQLMAEFELSQQAVADAVGRSRSAVANTLRLLKLPQQIQNWLHENKISMGHARAIITLPEPLQLELAQKVIDKQWTVRDIETAVQNILVPKNLKKAPKPKLAEGVVTQSSYLSEKIQTKVNIQQGAKGRGKIEIAFKSEEDCQRILEALNQSLTTPK